MEVEVETQIAADQVITSTFDPTFNVSFFVLPESPIGAVATTDSSLAAWVRLQG